MAIAGIPWTGWQRHRGQLGDASRRCRSRAAVSGSRPTTSPSRTSWTQQRPVVAVRRRPRRADHLGLGGARSSSQPAEAHLRPPSDVLPTELFATGYQRAVGVSRGHQLVDEAGGRAPEPVTSEVPTP